MAFLFPQVLLSENHKQIPTEGEKEAGWGWGGVNGDRGRGGGGERWM